MIKTVGEIIKSFNSEYPDRVVNGVYYCSPKQVLIDAPKKSDKNFDGQNSFVMNLLNGKSTMFNPMDNIDLYTIAHGPKRVMYKRT